MGTMITGLVICLMAGLAVRSIWKDKKSGKSCASCSGCSGCHGGGCGSGKSAGES